jgi:hypothetical protein
VRFAQNLAPVPSKEKIICLLLGSVFVSTGILRGRFCAHSHGDAASKQMPKPNANRDKAFRRKLFYFTIPKTEIEKSRHDRVIGSCAQLAGRHSAAEMDSSIPCVWSCKLPSEVPDFNRYKV